MPWIRVDMSAGRTTEQKRRVAEAMTEAMSSICGCSPESVSIVFNDVDNLDWASGGKLLSERKPAA
jgi:4-oxalocrotonate tautomerase